MKKNAMPFAKYYSIAVISVFALILIIPPTSRWFSDLSAGRPYLMGFIKFALLATVGEVFAVWVDTKQWQFAQGFLPKMLIWGFLGMVISLSFQLFSGGVAFAISNGYLPGANSKFLAAFFTSLTMNALFAPTFMAFHRITDTMIASRFNGDRLGFMGAVQRVDWRGFVSFVLFRTLPLFWIPMHTITFLLPPQLRVIFAAALSIALGVLLALAKKRR